jgi:replicative DNA helicase
MTQGLRRGSLVVLAGSTGMGKTALALNLARNISLRGEVAVHICALDSSPTALLQRMLASLCSVERGRIACSRLTAEEWPRLGEAMAQLSAAPLFFSGAEISTAATIRARCQELAAQSSEPLGLVVIDSLQLLGGEPAEQLKALRLLAAELQACVLLTCQSFPSVEPRPGGVPLLHDLPALEAMQTYPHVIGMLHREEYWDPCTSKRGQAELMLVKNSDNPLGTLRFGFEPMFSRFQEADPTSDESQLS